MIARNYRRFPEALLYQLELALGDVADTIQAIRVKGGAAWANLVQRFYNAPADVRGVVPVPQWMRELKKRARALAVDVKNRCLDLKAEKHQVDPPAPGRAFQLPRLVSIAIKTQHYRQGHLSLNDGWGGRMMRGFYKTFCDGDHRELWSMTYEADAT